MHRQWLLDEEIAGESQVVAIETGCSDHRSGANSPNSPTPTIATASDHVFMDFEPDHGEDAQYA